MRLQSMEAAKTGMFSGGRMRALIGTPPVHRASSQTIRAIRL